MNTLSDFIDFSEPQEKIPPQKDNPLGSFHIDCHLNCINRKLYSARGLESGTVRRIYTDERDLLVSASFDGKIEKFAIVDKTNINRRLLPGLFRLGKVKDEKNVPFVWNMLQINCARKQIDILRDSPPDTMLYKSIFDTIIFPDQPDDKSRIHQLNHFVYELARIACSGYCSTPLKTLLSVANKVNRRAILR